MRRATILAVAILVVLGLVISGMLTLPRASAQAEPIVLKIQASFPATSLIYTSVLPVFAERVDKTSDGRLKIEALPASTIVPPSRWWTRRTAGSSTGPTRAPTTKVSPTSMTW